MISIVLSKSVDKSNTKYYDVVIKWLNVTTLILILLLIVPINFIITTTTTNNSLHFIF